MVYNMSIDMFVALSNPTRRAILKFLASYGEPGKIRNSIQKTGETPWEK